VDAYDEEEERVVLRFHPFLAPIKVAVFPLMRKDGHPEKAREIERMLRPHFHTDYDEAGPSGNAIAARMRSERRTVSRSISRPLRIIPSRCAIGIPWNRFEFLYQGCYRCFKNASLGLFEPP
jgi:hypothetical protein